MILFFILSGKISFWFSIIILLQVGYLLLVAYFDYYTISISNHEIIIRWPFRKSRKTSYFINDIKAVSIGKQLNEGSKSEVRVFTVFKKDLTEDMYKLPRIFMAERGLLKELSKYVDVT